MKELIDAISTLFREILHVVLLPDKPDSSNEDQPNKPSE